MKNNLKNINDAEPDHSPNSLEALLAGRGSNVLRDSLMLMEPHDTAGRRLTAGYTVVYPGCRTSGHCHADREEIYFIVKGRGRVEIEDQTFEVKPGDTFYVEPGLFHTLHNRRKEAVEYFWVTVQLDESPRP